MIPEEKNKPIIRHAKIDHVEKSRLRGVIRSFAKIVEEKALAKLQEGMEGWDNPSPENLLHLRKELVRHVEKGMLERKDQEEDIALLAAFIWFNRLEEHRRHALWTEWG